MLKKTFLLAFILIFQIINRAVVFPQTISEKSVFNFYNLPDYVDVSSIRYDEKTGSYIYQDYDTVTQKTILFSNKGNSGPYDYLEHYNAIFDGEGNYFAIAYNYITDTTYTYFILRNGKEIASFDFITDTWIEKNGIIYFICKDKGKSCLALCDMKNAQITKNKEYDEIDLCAFPETYFSEEAPAYLGYTNEGKPYYIAKSNDEAFLVIGNDEQKHYSDIDAYTVKYDGAIGASGNFIYIAKSKGKFYDAGNTFVVMGDKEYKKFDYIYPPLFYDQKSGEPVYIASDSLSSDNSQRVMVGDNVAAPGTRGYSSVWNLDCTSGGKIYFVASTTNKNNESISFIVLNGTEGKKYQSIGNIKILPNENILFTATKDQNEAVIVNGTKEIETDFPTILDEAITGKGQLIYIDGVYGDYNKKKKDRFYLHIGDDESGPYDGFLPVKNDLYILTDNAGNYLYLTQRLINFKDYLYKQTLYSNLGNSKELDYFENIALINGKPFYTSSNSPDNTNLETKYQAYYDFKPITKEYELISDYKYDEANKLVSFIGVKGKDFFKVEIKF